LYSLSNIPTEIKWYCGAHTKHEEMRNVCTILDRKSERLNGGDYLGDAGADKKI
jgi:hypothetical protein